MGVSETAPKMTSEPWDAHPDCMANCDARPVVEAEIEMLDPADRARASSALRYCMTGRLVDPGLCAKRCLYGVPQFEQDVADAVDASHQPKVRAPRLEED